MSFTSALAVDHLIAAIDSGRLVLIFLLGQLPMAALALPPTSVDVRAYSTQCKIQVLKNIGWTVATPAQSSANLSVRPLMQTICDDQQTAPQITLPQSDSPALQEARLNQAFYSAALTCTYQQKYTHALLQATQSLKSDHLYWFTPDLIKDNLVEGGLSSHWQKIQCSQAECIQPLQSQNSIAVDSLYHSFYLSDCGLGLQMAEYATAKELLGDEVFDRVFAANEIRVGQWSDVQSSQSFTHGVSARKILPPQGLDYARSGYRSFIGVSGYIGAQKDATFLDDFSNGHENFVIVKSSAAAGQAWLARGGLQAYTAYLEKIWEFSRNVPPDELQAMENMARQGTLDGATDLQIQKNLPGDTQELFVSDYAEPFARLLSDPFLRDTVLYVHPMGERSLAWHILRLARINSRTPYALFFYNDTAHAEVMDRWLKAQLDQCQ